MTQRKVIDMRFQTTATTWAALCFGAALAHDVEAKAIASYNVDSYLDDPKDAVKLAVNFARLPDGTNYAQQSVLDPTAKQLEARVTNSDYKKLSQ